MEEEDFIIVTAIDKQKGQEQEIQSRYACQCVCVCLSQNKTLKMLVPHNESKTRECLCPTTDTPDIPICSKFTL